ncbi:asparagine synthase (glutamine-hydrolyzing) [Brevibacillus sp. SYSU BS000544]|uniref:asparagine synthase (glutamine-hydrolyzing) n=1 Tax=Brevibacillus sp. SYSU BS000544 TaxID=3416443 RepID=UPI003CE5AD65
MCGFAGIVNYNKTFSNSSLTAVLKQMTDAINYRGPDGEGYWVDESLGIGLGHRRLSIIDLSSNGHQPIVSQNGRYVMIYNGEVYNHQQLARELDSLGYQRKGHSDTEIILACFEAWGIDQSIQRFVGMFAIALFDRKEATFTLIRDRMGEKPLYYGFVGENFIFASEIKAFQVFPGFKGTIDRDAIASYIRYNYVPSPQTIYQHIKKLPPGTYLQVSIIDQTVPEPTVYWSIHSILEKRQAGLETIDEGEAILQLEALMQQSIRQQMIADVPIGAFFSGGVDSTSIVAMMQSLHSKPIKTFTIGFTDEDYNEAIFAKRIVEHLRTDHTELYINHQELMDVIPHIAHISDEPFSATSIIPTFLVSRLARQSVTVSLSGDGGDELFGGYNRHLWGNRIWEKVNRIPKGVRHATAAGMKMVPQELWNVVYNKLSPILPLSWNVTLPGEKVTKLAAILTEDSLNSIYVNLVSNWKDGNGIVQGASKPLQSAIINDQDWVRVTNPSEKMMVMDLISYLPDHILVKVDRASMNVSLESRAPFLDHRIVEFAWSLPIEMKIREGIGKWILRQILYKYVPEKLINRPKTGFSVPIGRWLRGPLREWAEDLLDEGKLQRDGFFDPKPIRTKWAEHIQGKRDWHNDLWAVLMFQAWFERHQQVVTP